MRWVYQNRVQQLPSDVCYVPRMTPEATLGSTMGASLLGGFATTILYGIICSQCYSFFQNRTVSHPVAFMKYLIAALWTVITAYTTIVMYLVYWYAVVKLGDPFAFLEMTWGIRVMLVMATISDLIVRSCLVHRAWILDTRKSLIPFILAGLLLCLFGVSLCTSVLSFRLRTLKDIQSIKGIYYATLIMVAIVDVLIAARLTYLLASMRRNVFKRTDSLLKVMMAYTINTGLVTSIVSIASLIAYLTMPHNYIFIAVSWPLSPLYVNALMASYNAKNWIRPSDPIKDIEVIDGRVQIRFAGTQETSIGPSDSQESTGC